MILFAEINVQEIAINFLKTGVLAGGTIAFFFAILFAGFALARIFSPPRKTKKYAMEEDRLVILRREDTTFRNAERFINELANAFWNKNPATLQSVSEKLTLLYPTVPWKPQEYIAVMQAEVMMYSIPVGILLWNFWYPLGGCAAGVGLGALLYYLSWKDFEDKYAKRLNALKSQLPFVIDLMALTRGAGASFTESLESAAVECKDHPISIELNHVIHHLKHGVTQHKALGDLAERVKLDEFREVVFAINKADELGTPLVTALSELAGQMRLRRQQYGEKISEEAKNKILGPTTLIMVACMITAVSPFILPAVLTSGIF